ncbi:MAG: metal ABC transporter substrate-binding protein [Longimicrobiales bacterium]|nr:metal ABC transporter substrate-binding protein [Longimicrobiales bacterium]
MTNEENMARAEARVQRDPGTVVRASLLLLALLSVVVAGGCGRDAPEGAGDGAGSGSARDGGIEGAPRVVASIFPIADLARSLVPPGVDILTLLGPATSPATFDPTPGAVRDVQRARLLLSVGGGLDAWTGALLETAPGARSVTLLEGVPLRGNGHGEGTGNPHLWLDPIRTRDLLVRRIADALAETFPADREGIRERERILVDTLTALHDEILRATASLPHRAFVASHAAWTYFAERYDLVQVGVIHEHPGQETSPRGLVDLVDRARAADVPVVFSEFQIPDVGARALAGELGVPVVPLDPLGGPGVPERDSYPALLRYNTAQLVLGLGRVAPSDGSDP